MANAITLVVIITSANTLTEVIRHFLICNMKDVHTKSQKCIWKSENNSVKS